MAGCKVQEFHGEISAWLVIQLNTHKLFNVKTIIAVFDATFAVAKRKPENIQVCTGIRTFELYDNGAALDLPRTDWL